MTERQWLNAKSFEDLHLDQMTKHRARKSRLLAAACCGRVVKLVRDYRLERTVQAVEQFADGTLTWNEMKPIRRLFPKIRKEIGLEWLGPNESLHYAAIALDHATHQSPSIVLAAIGSAQYAFAVVARGKKNEQERIEQLRQKEEKQQLHLAYDIFGNPFRPVAFDAAWQTTTAIGVAQQMYDSRDFNAMPILADALQDAGCEDDAILSHCRDENGIHVRGCWVVDLVLGKP